MLWRNTKECVVPENSCSKNFVNFQEKRPGEIAFLNKVAGYLTLTRNVLLGNLWNFQDRFHKKLPQMLASAISCHWKMFRPKDLFLKIYHSIWYSMVCAPRNCCITDVWRPFIMFFLVCSVTSLRVLFIWTSANVTSIVLITHAVIFSEQEVSRRRVACGSPGENKCSWNCGKKKQL